MKLARTLLVTGFLGIAAITILAFKQTTPRPEYMFVTTVESVIPGGLGRSRMIVTNPDGSQIVSDLKNLYSLGGINFENLSGNNKDIVAQLNALTERGWELHGTTAGVQSPSEGYAQGICVTRFIFTKNK